MLEVFGINYAVNFICNVDFNFNFDDIFGFFSIFLVFASIVFGVIAEILWYTHFFNKHQVINYSKFVKKSPLSFFALNLTFSGYYLPVYLEFFE